MTVRPIVIAGDPVLHNPTELVDLSAGVTPELRTLIADMVDTLAASGGCLLYTSPSPRDRG